MESRTPKEQPGGLHLIRVTEFIRLFNPMAVFAVTRAKYEKKKAHAKLHGPRKIVDQ